MDPHAQRDDQTQLVHEWHLYQQTDLHPATQTPCKVCASAVRKARQIQQGQKAEAEAGTDIKAFLVPGKPGKGTGSSRPARASCTTSTPFSRAAELAGTNSNNHLERSQGVSGSSKQFQSTCSVT